jgi:hypothetical protein
MVVAVHIVGGVESNERYAEPGLTRFRRASTPLTIARIYDSAQVSMYEHNEAEN